MVMLALALSWGAVQAADLPAYNAFEAQRRQHAYLEAQRQRYVLVQKQARQWQRATADACYRALMDVLPAFRQQEFACERLGGGHGCAGPEPQC